MKSESKKIPKSIVKDLFESEFITQQDQNTLGLTTKYPQLEGGTISSQIPKS